MPAGKLDQIVTLQRRVATPDGVGGTIEEWADLPLNARVWAHVGPRGGRERMNVDQIEASYQVVFTIRQRRDLDETMRILWDGVAYNIRGILLASHREEMLRIEAEKGVAP